MFSKYKFDYHQKDFHVFFKDFFFVILGCVSPAEKLEIGNMYEKTRNWDTVSLIENIMSNLNEILVNVYGRIFDALNNINTFIVPFNNNDLKINFPVFPLRTKKFLYIFLDIELFKTFLNEYNIMKSISDFFSYRKETDENKNLFYYDHEAIIEQLQSQHLSGNMINRPEKTINPLKNVNWNFLSFILIIILMPAIEDISKDNNRPIIEIKQRIKTMSIEPLVLDFNKNFMSSK